MNASLPSLRLAAAVLCLAAGIGAQAAPPKKTAAPAAKPAASAASAAEEVSAESLASRDQLRKCMDSEDALRARQKAINEENAGIAKQMEELQAEQATLAEAQGKLDMKDKKAVDAFNATLAEHNAKLARINEKAQAYNAKKDALNSELETYNSGCATYKYRADDRDAILKERAAKAGK